MSRYVSIAEFESIALSNYPNIILKALADDFEPEMFGLIPFDSKNETPSLEEGRKMLLSHIKKTAKKREALSFRYSQAIDCAEILLAYLKGGAQAAPSKAAAAVSDIERLEAMLREMPLKTRSDMDDRKEMSRRIARLSAERKILFEGLLSEKKELIFEKMYGDARERLRKSPSGADLLITEALGQVLSFREKDLSGLEALLLRTKQTRDVIEMAQWRLLDCMNAAIAGEWRSKDGYAIPRIPFPASLLSEKKALKAFFDNGASFALSLEGPIGTGKSSIAKEISEKAGLEPSVYAVPALHAAFFGVPFHDRETGKVRIVPTEDGSRLTTIPSCLVFDELLRVGNLGMDMQNMLLRLLLDGEVSPGRKLHPLTMKIVTTNNPDDTTNPHSMKDWNEALANRMKHYFSAVNTDQAREWIVWAKERFMTGDTTGNASSRVREVFGYLEKRLSERGSAVFYGLPKGKDIRKDPSFPTFRTWAAVLGAARVTDLSSLEFARTALSPLVGRDAADDFLKYLTAEGALPRLEELLETVKDFPNVYLAAAADSIVVNPDYLDEPEGGLTSKPKKKKRKDDEKEVEKTPFQVLSLGENTILQLNGGIKEAPERSAAHSGKSLLDRMSASMNREYLMKSEQEICAFVQEYMNKLWGGVDGATVGAAAESMLIGALNAHVNQSFAAQKPLSGTFMSDIFKTMALFPHPETRESMFRSIDRLLVSNPSKEMLTGLRTWGVDYTPEDEKGSGEKTLVRRLPPEAEDSIANNAVEITKMLAVFPPLATLEIASERWSRGCGRAASKYTAKKTGPGMSIAYSPEGDSATLLNTDFFDFR